MSILPQGSIQVPAASFPVEQGLWLQKPYILTEIDIYWVPRDSFPSGYNVYRGLAPLDATRMTLLNSVPVTIPFYRDVTIETRNITEYWYSVTEVMGDGSEISLGPPVSMQSFFKKVARRHDTISLPRIFQEYVRRKYIILDNDAETVALLIRKTAGTKCACYNDKYEQADPCNPNCQVCYGTPYAGGYEVIRDILFRILPTQQNVRATPWGVAVETAPPAWIADWPLLRNGDIVARADGARYTIGNLSLQIHQGILTEQTMDLAFIDPTHPIYQLDVTNGTD